MRFLIKQKSFAIGENMYVTDASSHRLFNIKNQFGIASVLDNQKRERAAIYLWDEKFAKSQEIYVGGALAATLPHEFIKSRRKTKVELVSGKDFDVQSRSILGFKYVFSRESEIIATLSKKVISFNETYPLDIERREDSFLILLVAVAVVLKNMNSGD